MGEPILTGEVKETVRMELDKFRKSIDDEIENIMKEQEMNIRKLQHLQTLFKECVCSKCEKRSSCLKKPGG